LVGPHEVEVEVGLEPEFGEGLVEQLAVLAGGDEAETQTRDAAEPEQDRGHFDHFGPGADDAGDATLRVEIGHEVVLNGEAAFAELLNGSAFAYNE
jgi:hypothetical protein